MKQRQTELDILRLLALLCVVGLHVNSSIWSNLQIMSFDWIVVTLQRITWAVPIFIMISGRFLLDPQRSVTLQSIWEKYISHIITAFIFWAMIYQIYYALINDGKTIFSQWKTILFGTVTGAYHMWYLWMLVGLYAITPILRKITEDKHLTAYFIGIYFVVQCLVYFATELPLVGGLTSCVMEKMNLSFVMGYTSYYLLGYFIYSWEPSKKQEYTLYVIGILITIAAPIGNIILATKTGEVTEYFTKYEAPTTFIRSAALYTFFVKRLSKIKWSNRTQRFFSMTTKYGFGAYLVHALINEIVIVHFGFSVMSFTPVFSITVLTLLIAGISFAITILLNKIPLIGKHIT